MQIILNLPIELMKEHLKHKLMPKYNNIASIYLVALLSFLTSNLICTFLFYYDKDERFTSIFPELSNTGRTAITDNNYAGYRTNIFSGMMCITATLLTLCLLILSKLFVPKSHKNYVIPLLFAAALSLIGLSVFPPTYWLSLVHTGFAIAFFSFSQLTCLYFNILFKGKDKKLFIIRMVLLTVSVVSFMVYAIVYIEAVQGYIIQMMASSRSDTDKYLLYKSVQAIFEWVGIYITIAIIMSYSIELASYKITIA